MIEGPPECVDKPLKHFNKMNISIVRATDAKMIMSKKDNQFKEYSIHDSKEDQGMIIETIQTDLEENVEFHIDNNSPIPSKLPMLLSRESINPLTISAMNSIYRISPEDITDRENETPVMVCDVCDDQFQTKDSILNHKRRNHFYQCDQCASNCSNIDEFINHGITIILKMDLVILF